MVVGGWLRLKVVSGCSGWCVCVCVCFGRQWQGMKTEGGDKKKKKSERGFARSCRGNIGGPSLAQQVLIGITRGR